MRLKSLKLAGFKSFANPTTFTFRHGITAIVGPNGCGKSNVIDAIRWVLGESSAKQLRGGAMSDVIFAGTQNKVAKSLASVELTFEHTQDEHTGIRHELNLYHELSVRRQVNADGKSDYFINGTKCRRRDVVDVFLGTGLGPRSYSVIQQGMIGRIVDSSPLQLREFIEEAAGVSRYQARREETQKKLSKTRENLDRLHDIKLELMRQKKKLIKQAESANAYQQVLNDLNNTKEQLAIHVLYHAKAAQMQHKASEKELAIQVKQLQDECEKLKDQLDKLNKRMGEEQWLKDDARERLHEHDMQRQQVEHKHTNIDININQLDNRLQSNLQRQQQSEHDIKELEKQVKKHNEMLKKLLPKQAQINKQQEQTKAEYAPLQSAWEATTGEVTQLQKQKNDIEQQLALNEHAQNRQQADLQKWQSKYKAWQVEAVKWQLADADVKTPTYDDNDLNYDDLLGDNNQPHILTNDYEVNLTHFEDEIKSLQHQQDAIADRLEIEQPILNRLKIKLDENQLKLADIEKRHASLMGEYDTLHSIVHRPTKPSADEQNNSKSKHLTCDHGLSIQQGVNKNTTLQNTLSKFQQLPTLSDSIELSKTGKQYAHLLDKWLALWLDSRIWLDSEVSARNAHQTNLQPASKSDASTLSKQSGWAGLLTVLSSSVFTYATNTVHKASNNHNSDKSNALSQNQPSHFDGVNSVFLVAKQHPKSNLSQNLVGNLDDESNKSVSTLSANPKLIPLADLIASPVLTIWHHCYLYVDEADYQRNNESYAFHAQQEFTTLINKLPIGAILLTASGWLITSYLAIHLSKLTGNSHNEEFLTARIRQQERLATLEEKLTDMEAQIDAIKKTQKHDRAEHEQLSIEIEELLAQLNGITHQLHEYKQRKTEIIAKRDQWQREQSRLKQQRTLLDDEHDALIKELKSLQNTEKQKLTELAVLTPKLTQTIAKQSDIEQNRQKINEQERLNNNELTAIQLDVNKAEMASKHSTEQLAKLQNELMRLQQTEQKILAENEKVLNQKPKLQEQLKALTLTCYEQRAALDERLAVISGLQDEINQLQTFQNDANLQLQGLQVKLADSRTQLAVADERIKEASERLLELGAEVSPSSLLTDYIAHGRTVSEEKLLTLQNEEHKLTAQLNSLGSVNLAAAAELATVDERLSPLEQQINDITDSMETLVDAIASIDEKTKSLFMDTLNSVNESLTDLFTKVFGGGQASLTLIKDEGLNKNEQWRAGLDLMAQPKGKKNSRLAVLSGGEKTLTALSLIFAIFKQHPAPFCVLDEVDAPLDDANVGRFTNLIDDLANDVQFIFISHNKLAMQIADELKGITMPQPGISTLVSVSLEEAEQYLEPNA